MTRFARAKGSKASNEKLPESSTPWSIMKQDLEKAQMEAKIKPKRDEINQERQKNYEKFVEETESKTETKWASFPKPNLKTIKKKKSKNKNLLKLTENDVTDEMIQELCHPDPEVDGQLENMTAKIEEALAEDKGKLKKEKTGKKQKKKKTVKEDNQENDNNEDEAPEEASTKIAPPEIVVKKAKNKKKALKIPSVIEKEDNGEKEQDQKQKKNKNKREKKKKNKEEDGKFVKANNQQRNQEQKPDGTFVKNNTNNQQNPGQKRKLPKERDNKEHKRRKPLQNVDDAIKINGEFQDILRYQGFPVLKSDHDRLVELRKSLISKGVPRSEVNKTMKLERRKAEKVLSRAKKIVCFQCRESGHLLSECPQLKGNDNSLIDSAATGVCFKCGSTEHTYKECKVNKDFKYAKCFICREQGHISSQCPDNPRGLYPKGGACNLCGDVTHLKKDCPKHVQEQQNNQIFLNKISDGNIESIEADGEKPAEKKKVVNKKKVVKF